ncbi:hypothetical protein PC121_g7692 [Phytophthora cactorum]|nr:hypothetical protein PC121_g7692 [Phytophthora cactorum]
MLEMRFDDEVVKDRIKAADTNIKNHWDTVSNKYIELQYEYKQGIASRQQTGDNCKEDESELWGILNSHFTGRTGINAF